FRSWRGSAALDLVRDVSLPGKAVCRCRLSGTAVRHGSSRGSATPLGRDRETFRPGERLRSPTNALGRRAHLGVAQSLPSPRQGLRKPQPQCASISAACINPPDAAKALQSGMNFPDRLLEGSRFHDTVHFSLATKESY